MSQYLILIYGDEVASGKARQERNGKMLDEHRVFGEKNAEAIVGGNALQATSTATSIRPDDAGGFAVTDGPFAETKEALGGYYLVEAPDLDAAIDLAKQVPVLAGGVEVRPVVVFD